MSEQVEIRAVVFDMGGVIVRTMDRNPRAKLAARYGLSYAAIDDAVFNSATARLATLGQVSEADHWRAVAAQLKLDGADLSEFRTQFWAGDAVDQELITFINALRPKMRTGLLSNAWSDAREVVRAKYAFLHVFDAVIFSAEVGLAKPDPQIYQLMLAQLAVSPQQSIFVDDFLENVEAARAVGMHAIQFRSFEQFCADYSTMIS